MTQLTVGDVLALQNTLPALTTTSVAHPDTWNPIHQALLNNDVFLANATEAAQAALAAIDGRVVGLENSDNSAPVIASSMRLNWLYSNTKVAFELFMPSWTLIDIPPIAVQSGIAGDDSIDVASTTGLIVDNEYVIFDGAHRETVMVSTILTANRIRIASALAYTYGATATLARTSLTIANGAASAVANDVYFAQKINLGSDGITRAVVMRRQNNAANIRVYFKDTIHAVWTEAVWAWKRTAAHIPVGYADIEYPVPANGDTLIKVVVEGAACVISHIVGLAAATQLGGTHNAPVTPVNASPAVNSINLPERPTLTLSSYVSPVGSALSGVRFQVATSVNGFGSPYLDSGQQPAGLSYQIPAGRLSVNTAYWFSGSVQDYEGAWSQWSTPTQFTTAASFVYVQAPANVGPAAGATNIAATPTLSSSAFAVAGGTDTHAASRWQIRTATGTYSTPAWDSGADAINKTSIVVPSGVLSSGQTTYYWRSQQEGTVQGWSEWSAESGFTTQQNFGGVIGIALVSTGGGAGTWQRIDDAGNAKTTDSSYFNNHPTYAGVVAQTIDGQAMVRVPAFYYKTATIASGPYAGKKGLWICDQPQPGFSLHPAFMNAGSVIAQYWVGKYQAGYDGTGKATSTAGVMPMTSVNFSTMQARCNARNTGGVTGFGLWSIYQLAAIQMLALIEMGGTDSRSLIGYGNVGSGAVLAVDNATVIQATYRGFAGLWGNAWQMVDGMQIDTSNNYKIWDKNGNKVYFSTTQVNSAFGAIVTMSTASNGTDYDLSAIFVPATVDSTFSAGTYGDLSVGFFANGPVLVGGSGFSTGGLFCIGGIQSGALDATTGGRLAKV